jgi:hypothetical protein
MDTFPVRNAYDGSTEHRKLQGTALTAAAVQAFNRNVTTRFPASVVKLLGAQLSKGDAPGKCIRALQVSIELLIRAPSAAAASRMTAPLVLLQQIQGLLLRSANTPGLLPGDWKISCVPAL